MARKSSPLTLLSSLTSVGLAAALTIGAASAAWSEIVEGPVDLGTAGTYGVLATDTVTNTGPTVVTGDLGLSPGTSITGFGGLPNGVVLGTTNQTNAAAAQAQSDALSAYGVAASLSPTETGYTNLAGLSLVPGVYRGGALSLPTDGVLTLAGSAESVWVFQAGSTLTLGTASEIVFTGGASACNVIWQVGSSATIGTNADFRGTILADTSVSVGTGADVIGGLIALDGAVTLLSNTVTAPTGCDLFAPTITSDEPMDGSVGEDYDFTITADGNPEPEFSVTGDLPEGLELDEETGRISGTPTDDGDFTFTVTASNGVGTDDTATYTISVEAGPSPTPTPTPTDDTIGDGSGTGGGGSDDGSGTGGGSTDGGSDDLVVEGIELARTGFDNRTLVVAAAFLLLAGAAVFATGRRRPIPA